MELSKINELMAERGYTQPIGAIFPDWNLLKMKFCCPTAKAKGQRNRTCVPIGRQHEHFSRMFS